MACDEDYMPLLAPNYSFGQTAKVRKIQKSSGFPGLFSFSVTS